MTRHRHTLKTLGPDYVRAGVGLLLTIGPVAAVPTTRPVFWALCVFASLFAIYGMSVGFRHLSIVEVDEGEILAKGFRQKRIAWRELRDLRLRYFSTRRDGARGWMQLVLKGTGVSIRIESTLGGFADIVKRAARAANDEGLDLSPATLGNLELLGVKTEVFTSASGSP